MERKKIEIPKTCPCCDYPLEVVNNQLFCRNSSCEAVSSKQISHFAKTMGIKGLGDKTIDKLMLSSIPEIYSLSESKLTQLLGSEKIASKLFEEIEKSKQADLIKVISSFGVPLIGKTAATKLCSVISSIDDISFETCNTAGLGEKATDNIMRFITGEFVELREYLPLNYVNDSIQEYISETGKTVCITGSLKSFKSKAEASNALIQQGFKVVDSVTKNTDFLVDEGSKGSAKRTKADTIGVPIISDLLKFLRENN